VSQLHEGRDIDLDHFILLLPGPVHKGTGVAEARVVDQDIHGQASFLCKDIEFQSRVLYGQVAGAGPGPDPICIFQIFSDGKEFFFIPGHKDQVAALPGTYTGKFQAQAAGRELCRSGMDEAEAAYLVSFFANGLFTPSTNG
jgi:hypothetical protein